MIAQPKNPHPYQISVNYSDELVISHLGYQFPIMSQSESVIQIFILEHASDFY